MTRKYTTLSSEKCPMPFLLKPAGKDYLWGGNRLNDDFSKGMDMEPLAETWECSTHPDGVSVAGSGSHEGIKLTEILKAHPEYMGRHRNAGGELPILVKFIDAKKNLSVQVHPDDNYAWEHENGALGKTEMWYVLDARKDARIIYGFYHDMDKKSLHRSLLDGTVEKYLQKIPVKRGDVFFINAGQVHAICAGTLVAEIQENSNLTYRMYDYNRTDRYGKKRELHIEKALDVADLKGGRTPKQPMRLLRYAKGCAAELLCRCEHFQVERLLVNTERQRGLAEFHLARNTFQVMLCINGCGTLVSDAAESINIFKGDCVFIPAGSRNFKIHGKMQMLRVTC